MYKAVWIDDGSWRIINYELDQVVDLMRFVKDQKLRMAEFIQEG